MTKRTLPPIEALVLADELDDVTGLTEEEVLSELRAAGLDLGAASRRVERAIELVEAEDRRSRLTRARSQRLSHANRNRLAGVQAQQMPIELLREQVRSLQGQVAHRELDGETREDLESLLADLLDLADESG